jgi:hypothetical protein
VKPARIELDHTPGREQIRIGSLVEAATASSFATGERITLRVRYPSKNANVALLDDFSGLRIRFNRMNANSISAVVGVIRRAKVLG